jgi:anti-sigma factor (TIGR02949 family)
MRTHVNLGARWSRRSVGGAGASAGSNITADDNKEEETVTMTCRDAIDVIADFLEQTLTSSALEELEAHLRECEPCRAHLNTYRKTRTLVGVAGQAEMPAELKTRLRRFLIEQLGAPPA